MPEPLWAPSASRIEKASITGFRRRAELETGEDLPDYFALHDWSVRDIAAFWSFYLRDSGLKVAGSHGAVHSAEPMPGTRWFDGATLNYARLLLHPPGVAESDAAIIAVDESGADRSLSWRGLREQVAAVQRSLRAAGVGEGDRVAAFAANVPETVIVLLACASLGAIFTSCSPDFGFEAAHSRFGQVGPRLLFATTRYRYGGRIFDTSDTVARLSRALGVERTVLLPYPPPAGDRTSAGGAGDPGSGGAAGTAGDGGDGIGAGPGRGGTVEWHDWIATYGGEPEFRELPFDHPLYVLYSSGTTGSPKAMVHRAGGALLTHHKELRLHSDVGPGDRVAYFTTCGWMMWNWLVSALSLGATIVLVEGSPAFPRPDALLLHAERLRLTFVGTSARYLHSLQALDWDGRALDLSSVRTIASTGSPLSRTGFEYVYRRILSDVHLASISGGTDIVGCFMLGVPTLPVFAGQIQAPGLGVDLAAFDEDGRPVVGEPGELVCRQPLPSMPLRFWNDPGDERYRSAYFSHYPGVWRHGDLIELTGEGGVIVHGRSDATLNPGGVRIGTAEIYRPLESFPEVVEAAAVGRREEGDESVWLFVVLRDGVRLEERLVAAIRRRIRESASPRHVPARVLQVRQLPRTRSGKSMELAVACVVNGRPLPNREVVANPESLGEVESAVRAALGAARRS